MTKLTALFPMSASNQTRFWSKVDKRGPDECWPWQGWMPGSGYGSFKIGTTLRQATQVVWSLANREPFPSDKIACHSCDNPGCVNPAHIWPGTVRENHDDSVAKGRKIVRMPA